jgi:hypothetical protein
MENDPEKNGNANGCRQAIHGSNRQDEAQRLREIETYGGNDSRPKQHVDGIEKMVVRVKKERGILENRQAPRRAIDNKQVAGSKRNSRKGASRERQKSLLDWFHSGAAVCTGFSSRRVKWYYSQ